MRFFISLEKLLPSQLGVIHIEIMLRPRVLPQSRCGQQALLASQGLLVKFDALGRNYTKPAARAKNNPGVLVKCPTKRELLHPIT
jgi:hypothetical protein